MQNTEQSQASGATPTKSPRSAGKDSAEAASSTTQYNLLTSKAPITINAFDPEDKVLLKKFIQLPWDVYNTPEAAKEDKNWVPPLRLAMLEMFDRVKNPFWKRSDCKLFLATQEDRVVGRIAAIENRAHNEFHKDQWGFYGFFESFNNQDVANQLFDAASSWLKGKGKNVMVGPTNPSTNHECGLLVRGHSQHTTLMTTYNPKYYIDLHEKAGLTKAKDTVGYWLPTDKMVDLPPKVVAYVEKIRKSSNIVFRDFDMKNFQREVDMCFDIYNSAWEKNWGFFPMTKEEFNFMAKEMKMIMDKKFAFVAEKDGKPAGFMLALPDANHIFKRIKNGKLLPTGIFKLLLGKNMLKSVRVLTLGVKPEYRGSGIFALFTYESFLRAKAAKLVGGEASWILEDNEAMNKPWLDLGAPLYRRWRIYERKI